MTQYKRAIDWFLEKGKSSQVIIILLLVLVYLGYNYYENQEILALDVVYLESKVRRQDSTILDLNKEIQNYKLNSILHKANEDTSPVPMFLVDVKTGNALWVNKAYESKYLLPNLTNREEFIGTDGAYVFGDNEVKKFQENNSMVYKLQKPITFNNEANTTITKFPVMVGDYIYAIGGIEYIKFN